MNDKIKELAKQAGLMCLYDYGPEEDPHAMVVGQKDMELFAELIIQSIADIDFWSEIGVSSDQDFDIRNLIKNHFKDEQ